MRQLRFAYVFPTGYVQKYPALKDYQLTLPIMWGYSTSSVAPTQAEVDGFTVIQSSLNPLNAAVTASYSSSGHTTQYLVALVPVGLEEPTSVTASTLTMAAQSDLASFNANEAQLMYRVYISTALIATSGILTITP
jgi:hypothetical protein